LAGAALVASAAGVSVLLHGHESVPERSGTASVLATLGIPVDLDPPGAVAQWTDQGFAYLDIALYHPPVARFLELRRELGLRNLFHPVAKLLSPARPASQILAFTHPPYFDKSPEVLQMLGAKRALILRGVEGEPELSLAAMTRVQELRDGRVFPLTLQAKDVGIPPGSFQDMAGFPNTHAGKEAALLRRILHNDIQGGPRNWVVMNAALLLYAAGKAPSISSAVPLADQALTSGAAARKLAEVEAAGHPAATPAES
jgi:anthranilate phosphoribosyltransferase